MLSLSFTIAQTQDIDPLVTLVNSAYRGEISKQGWTTEADLLDGYRTDAAELQRLIASNDSMIILCKSGKELIGSVHIQSNEELVYLGMLAVKPTLQGGGVGKQLLQTAELAAQQNWVVSKFVMAVITTRQELIAFYERRGYQRTGTIKEFPINPALWTPKVAALQLELLEKIVTA